MPLNVITGQCNQPLDVIKVQIDHLLLIKNKICRLMWSPTVFWVFNLNKIWLYTKRNSHPAHINVFRSFLILTNIYFRLHSLKSLKLIVKDSKTFFTSYYTIWKLWNFLPIWFKFFCDLNSSTVDFSQPLRIKLACLLHKQ